MTTPTEIDHVHTDDIVCPYCGYADRDSWDHEWHTEEGTISMDCDCCGKEFSAWRDVSVSYTTESIDAKGESHE